MNTWSAWLLAAGYLTTGLAFAQDTIPPGKELVSEEINRQLPSWLRFGGEERARMESINGENFKPIGDLYLLNRLRLNMGVLPRPWFRFIFQAEDARVFGQNTRPAPATQKDAMDLRLGYAAIGSPEGPAMLTAGRQPLDFGEGRLLADPDWSNVGKSFDAVRVTLHQNGLKLDLFSGAVVKIDPTNFDLPAPGEHFDGAYGSVRDLVPGAVIEPYIFWRMEHNYKDEEGKLGNLSEQTYGLRWAGKLPAGFDYTVEVADQAGSYAHDPIRAWMGHSVAGYTLPVNHQPRFFVEYNRASGDRNPKDGVRGTFDSLFPASHDKFGLTDLFCGSNIRYFRPGFQYMVRRGITLGAAYDDFWLDSPNDALYISAKSFVRNTRGTAGTHIGQEGDVQAQWAVSSTTRFAVGYGRLLPGEFLRETTAGVPYNIFFLNVAQRF